IVPARDAAETIGATLTALQAQDLVEHEVIVVDNGSHDPTAALARDAGARVLQLPRGQGPGAARNAGAAAARGAVLAFTDADCEPAPGWLRAGLAAIDDGLDLVQGRVEPNRGVRRGPFDRSLWVTRAWGLFETADLF